MAADAATEQQCAADSFSCIREFLARKVDTQIRAAVQYGFVPRPLTARGYTTYR